MNETRKDLPNGDFTFETDRDAALRALEEKLNSAKVTTSILNGTIDRSVDNDIADWFFEYEDLIRKMLSEKKPEKYTTPLSSLRREQPRHIAIGAQERYEEGYVNGWNDALERAELHAPQPDGVYEADRVMDALERWDQKSGTFRPKPPAPEKEKS